MSKTPLDAFAAYVLAMRVKNIRRATKYIGPGLVAKVTLHGWGKKRPSKRAVTASLTVGVPNYAERQFIKACKKAGEPFPVKKVQYRYFKR